MSRPLRIEFPAAWYHVWFRGQTWTIEVREMGEGLINLHFHFGGVLIEESNASKTPIKRSRNASSRYDSRNRRGIDFC